MLNKYLWIFIIVLISACTHVHFMSSSLYQKKNDINNIYLIVIGDEKTRSAYNYVTENLEDSLKSYVNIEAKYHCCRDGRTDMKELLSSLNPSSEYTDHVLTVVTTKVVIGYGTDSSRELEIYLFDSSIQKMVWYGEVLASMDFFVSDDHYRALAGKLSSKIMEELHLKGII